MNNNELYHYGVPGMRWGVRKDSRSASISRRSKKEGWHEDATEAAKINTKKVNQMSNAELKKVNERKNLEQNYRNLNPGVIKKGLLIAGATAAAMGTILALRKNSKELFGIGKKTVSDAKSNNFWKQMKKTPKTIDLTKDTFENFMKK